MMEIERLRKADIFSGALVVLTGMLVILQAMKMPMKDSYGGVQNVWYVSPALFPLLVGGMLILLGLVLIRTALKAVGLEGIRSVLSFICSSELFSYFKEENNVRYYGVVVNLLGFVFVFIPHVDFFPAAILFLLVLFFMYYCGDHGTLRTLLKCSLGSITFFGLFFFSGLDQKVSATVSYPGDWLTFMTIAILIVYGVLQLRTYPEQARRFRISLIIAVVAPFTVGIIFKYFLLVPMPSEGLVIQLLDTLWYMEF
ncbi:hypothetical protein [Desulfopila aestuarii]|uniref:Tripartite tricarboxylate transporter TctB family protein n=1 Tax=Desulfopila aestuarii DSM 18488 TaxID=1121416 RepID=A0A1M7YDZ8_9BACT|nr:hypothetical protein [Desulfopila aestuarii]SHO50870.1 hypothetical protein SAMN02745220_03679 [Desulfopila aestuarii DSM 18488]